jgi:hypothetical protein
MCPYTYYDLLDLQGSFQVRDFRHASFWDSHYEAALDGAEESWARAPGPQAPSEPDFTFGDPGDLPWGYDAFYLNCPEDGNPVPSACSDNAFVCMRHALGPLYCDVSSFNAMIYVAANVYVDHDWFITQPAATRTSVMAHEMGHALGLGHHGSSACLMQEGTSHTAPQPCDLGFADPFYGTAAPCSGAPSGAGIRCIFEWWREQAPGLDCYDVLRNDGAVTVPDILETAASFGIPAGELDHNPDADIDHSGTVITHEVIQVGGQFGDFCSPPDHYVHS